MIKQFGIKDFKCHEDYNYFKLPGLSIVTGTNNSGKSSLLQSIYLLTQNQTKNYPVLALNEELNLGGFSDVLNKSQSSSESIEITIDFEEYLIEKDGLNELNITLVYHNPNILKNFSVSYLEENPVLFEIYIDYYRDINGESHSLQFRIVDEKIDSSIFSVTGTYDNGYCKIGGIVPEPIIYENIDRTNKEICSSDFDVIRKYLEMLNNENIKYIRAFRLDNFAEKNNSVNRNLGLSGEYTAEVINTKWDNLVDFVDEANKPLLFSKLFDQWIQRLLGDNYRIRSHSIDKGKYKIVIQESNLGYEFTLNQVGFGISQLLPIITLLLTSKKGDMILVENPEVHLHPKLQAMFIDLCLFVLKNKRKLIIETHSEHIINRLRVRIKEDPELLHYTNIYFFEKLEGNIVSQEIEITKEGKLEYWPPNFFDQTYNDLLGLI